MIDTLCEFRQTADGWKCPRCLKVVRTARAPRRACPGVPMREASTVPAATADEDMPFRLLTSVDLPCAHRGAVTRQERCRLVSCKGGKEFDVHRCEHFGDECSIQNRAVKDLRVCKKCPARSADGLVTLSVPAPVVPTADIAVIVPCHNYAEFLSECLDSVLAQTLRPSTILVVDDSSTDDPAAVVAEYHSRGVRYMRVEHGNAHATRGAGFRVSQAEWVCFLDADDVIPPNYLAEAAKQFATGVAIVYTDVEQFGAASGRIVFQAGDITAQNFAHAGSVARRIALESAQVFERELPPDVLEDWWMWRQVLEAGWKAVKSPALYGYRRHDTSRSTQLLERDPFNVEGRSVSDITIAIPLAGRAQWWPRLRDWLEQQTWPHEQTRLLIVDTSDSEAFSSEVRTWLATCDYPSTQYIAMRPADAGIADADRHQHAVYRGVQAAMPRIYNRIRTELTTGFVLIVEDDILPPEDVAERMLRSFDQDTVSVTGAYRSRYQTENYIAWDRGSNPLQTAGDGVQVIGGNGFGCVMLRASVLKETVLHHGGLRGDFDPNFYKDIDPRWVAKMDWSIRCDHAGLAA